MKTGRSLPAMLLLVSLFANPVRGQEAQAPAADPEVEQLIKDLGDADSRTRSRAREALAARGEEVEPRLTALAKETQDPEVRAAADSILAAIKGSRRNGPSLITLDVKDAPAQQVFESIAKQAGVTLRPWPDTLWKHAPKKTLSVSVKRKPFWEVMRELLPAAGLSLNDHGQGLQLMQGDQGNLSGPAHVAGAFMVVAAGANESRSIRYGGPVNAGGQSHTSINMTVFIEPKLKLLGRSYRPVIEEFVDDAGHSLVVPVPPHQTQLDMHSQQSVFQVSVDVPQVQGRTKRVARLKGAFPALLLKRTETLEVPDVLKAEEATVAGAGRRLVVHKVSKAGDAYTVEVTYTIDEPLEPAAPGGGGQWRRQFSQNAFRLLDADGRELVRQGHSASGSDNQWKASLRFFRGNRGGGDDGDKKPGEPAKLVWDVPVEVESVSIPFDFKDLALP